MQEGFFNEIEYQEFGDTRNPKGFSEDNYNKHNKGKKEMTRISYAKSKRAEQSFQDRIKHIKKRGPIDFREPNKRILKFTSINDKEYENNTQEIIKKQKKKKIPKKDRVRF